MPTSKWEALCHVTPLAFQRALHAVLAGGTAERWPRQREVITSREMKLPAAEQSNSNPVTHLLLTRDFRIKQLGEKLAWKTSTLPKASFPAHLSSNTFQAIFLTNCLGVKFHKREKKRQLKPNLCGGRNALRAEGVHAAGQLNPRHLLRSAAPHPLETTDILPAPNSTSSNGS